MKYFKSFHKPNGLVCMLFHVFVCMQMYMSTVCERICACMLRVPEWCISSMIYSRDTPFWSETLDMYVDVRVQVSHKLICHSRRLSYSIKSICTNKEMNKKALNANMQLCHCVMISKSNNFCAPEHFKIKDRKSYMWCKAGLINILNSPMFSVS